MVCRVTYNDDFMEHVNSFQFFMLGLSSVLKTYRYDGYLVCFNGMQTERQSRTFAPVLYTVCHAFFARK
jgi:hypothetical protein